MNAFFLQTRFLKQYNNWNFETNLICECEWFFQIEYSFRQLLFLFNISIFFFKNDANENSFFIVFVTTNDENFFITTNNEKSNVFETFLFFNENKTNENKYFHSTSFSIICLKNFFASRSIINFVNINFYKFSSLFDSMFIIFVKSFCDMSNVSFVKKNSLTNWIKFISLKR